MNYAEKLSKVYCKRIIQEYTWSNPDKKAPAHLKDRKITFRLMKKGSGEVFYRIQDSWCFGEFGSDHYDYEERFYRVAMMYFSRLTQEHIERFS